MLLGQELIDIFDAQVLILLDVGSGEMLKAVLAQNALAVCVCASATHKTFVMTCLRDFVKTRGLVNTMDKAPKKPDDVIAYEQSLQPGKAPGQGTLAAALGSTQPAPNVAATATVAATPTVTPAAPTETPGAPTETQAGQTSATQAKPPRQVFAFGTTVL